MNTDSDTIRPLLSAFIDGELTPDESITVNDALMRSADLREEYERLLETSQRLDAVSTIEPDEAILNELWRSPFSRFARNAAITMIAGGYLILILWSAFILLFTDETPVIPGIAYAALVIGFLLLLAILVRNRLKTWQHDPYKHIKR